MSSREKQRRALHAQGGVLQRVRMLPLYMKVINVILAIILAFGVGANWAYAAEFMPEGDQSLELAWSETKTLTAPTVKDASSYEWQIYSEEVGDYAVINNEKESTLDVDSAMLVSAINNDRVATVRCAVTDSSKNVTYKNYFVTLGQDTTEQQAKQDASSLVKAAFPGVSTVYAKGALNSKSNDANNAESNADPVKVKIVFYDSADTPKPLGYEVEQEFDAAKEFSWFMKLDNTMGEIVKVTWDGTWTEDQFTASIQDPELFDTGVYCASAVGMPEGSTVEVHAFFDINKLNYTLHARYEKLETGASGEALYEDYYEVKEGAPGTIIPTLEDREYLESGTANFGDGWNIFSYISNTVQDVQQDKGGITVDITLNRTYHFYQFDPNGGVNGPTVLYMRNGESFSSVSSWEKEDGTYLPTPEPTRNAYVFKGWECVTSTSTYDMPLNDWKDLGTPGEDVTYRAKWARAASGPVQIAITYWGEKADSFDYEYLAERYDRVDYSKVGQNYTLPIPDNPKTAAYDSNNMYDDRRFPQRRVDSSSDQYTLAGPLEVVESTGTYTFDKMYFYDSDDSHTKEIKIKDDGTTVVNVYLKRKVFKLEFNYNNQNHNIYARWDQEIYDATQKDILDPRYVSGGSVPEKETSGFMQMCDSAKNNTWHINKWSGGGWEASGPYLSIITHMLYWNNDAYHENTPTEVGNPQKDPDNYYWGAFHFTTHENGDAAGRYYLQLVGKPFEHVKYTEKDREWFFGYYDVNKYMMHFTSQEADAEEYYYKPVTQYAENFGYYDKDGTLQNTPKYISSFNKSYYITDDEFINIIGFKTPKPGVDGPQLYDTIGSDGYSFYYERNTWPLYITNIYGADRPEWHYDYWVTVNSDVQFETPWNSIKVGEDEVIEYEVVTQSGIEHRKGNVGYTNLKQGDLISQAYNPDPAQSKIRVPSALVDEHWVFEGFYESADFSPETKIWGPGDDPANVTWTMPNHEANIYCKWVAPERYLQVYDNNPETGDFKYGDVHQITYGDNIDPSYIPEVDPEREGQRFRSWYYYASEADQKVGNKTWFDPYTMTMPYVEWGETTMPDGTPVVHLRQEWVVDHQVEYKVNFVLSYPGSSEDGDLVANPVTGYAQDGDQITVVGDPKEETDFYVTYRGILGFCDLIPGTSDEQPDKITLTLDQDDEDANTYTFYYYYNNLYYWQWQTVYHYFTEDPTSGAKIEHFDPIETSAWFKSGGVGDADGEGHYSVATKHVPDTSGKHDYDYKLLKSATTLTITLVADTDPTHQTHPDRNIIQFIFEDMDPVQFHFTTKFWNGSSYTDVKGGSVDPTYQQVNVNVDAKSAAKSFPAYKYRGWYYTDDSGNPTTPVDAAYIETLSDGSKQLTCPKDASQGIYLKGGTYCAVFEKESDTVKLQYDVYTVDSSMQVISTDPEGFTLSSYSENIDPLTTGTATGTSVTAKPAGYNFIGWAKLSDWSTESTTENPFVPSKSHFTQGTVDYYYYYAETYVALYREFDAVTITYKVADGFGNFGDVAINNEPATKGNQASEDVMPYTGTPKGANAIEDDPTYKFVGWEKYDKSGVKDTSYSCNTPVVQLKKGATGTGPLWDESTYVAVFKLDVFNLSFEAQTHADGWAYGDVAPYTVGEGHVLTVHSNTTISIDNDSGTMTITDPFDGAKTETTTARWGYKPDKQNNYWKIVEDGVEKNITSFTINKATHFRAKYVEDDTVTLNTYLAEDSKNMGNFTIGATSTSYMTSYSQEVKPISGSAYTMYPHNSTAYEFKKWSWDQAGEKTEGITPGESGEFAIPKVLKTYEGEDHEYWAYEDTDIYLHFGTYECIVNFYCGTKVDSDPVGEITWTPTVETIKVDSSSKYKISNSRSSGHNVSTLTIYKPGSTTESYGSATADRKVEYSTYEFDAWKLGTGISTDVNIPFSDDDKIISEKVTNFSAWFAEQGAAPYRVRVLRETVAHAKDSSAEDGNSWLKGYDEIGYVDADTKPTYVIEKSAGGGSQPQIERQTLEGFTVVGFARDNEHTDIALDAEKPWGDSGISTTPEWLEDQTHYWNSHDNTIWVKYNRIKNYPFKVRLAVESVDSAKNHALDPQEFSNNREYVDRYTTTKDRCSTPHVLEGIYGDTITYEAYDPGKTYTKIGGYILDPNHWITEGTYFVKQSPNAGTDDPLTAHAYEIGMPKGSYQLDDKDVITLYFNRSLDTGFGIKYYKQNLNGTYPEDPTYTLGSTSNLPDEYKARFTGITGSMVDITADTFDLLKWDSADTRVKEIHDAMIGYTKQSVQPASIKISSQATNWGSIYYSVNTNTEYTYAEYMETVASAAAREAGGDPSAYVLVTNPPETRTGLTGDSVPIATDDIKTKFAGCTWVKSTSGVPESDTPAEEITILGDGSARANVYYKLNKDTAYQVRHNVQNFNESTGQPIDGSYSVKETENKTGITGDTINTTESGQAGYVVKNYPGFTYQKDLTKPENNPKIDGSGKFIVDLFYSRNENTPWKVEYYIQKLDDLNNYELEKTVDGGTATTGTIVDYSSFINDPQIENPDNYKFAKTTTVPLTPGTNLLRVDAFDGSYATAKIYFDRKTDTPYQIIYKVKNLGESTYRVFKTVEGTGITGREIDFVTTREELPGYSYENKCEPTSGKITIGTATDTYDIATGVLYYTPRTDTKYVVNLYKEKLTSAQQRQKGGFDPGKDPSYYDLTVDTRQATTDSTLTIADQYDEIAGYSVKSVDPSGETVVVKNDGTTQIDVYYWRELDTKYTIKYHKETLESATQHLYPKRYSDSQDEFSGITGDTVSLTTDALKKKFPGYDWEKSDPLTLGIAGDGSSVGDIWYTLNGDVQYTVYEYFEKRDVAIARRDSGYDPQKDQDFDHNTETDEFTQKAYHSQTVKLADVTRGRIGFIPWETIPKDGLTVDAANPANNKIKIYYYRRLDVQFTIHYMAETVVSAQQMIPVTGTSWDPAEGIHHYSEYSKNDTYRAAFEEIKDITNPVYSITVPGAKLEGYKIGQEPGGTIIANPKEVKIELPNGLNDIYIYYTLTWDNTFYVKHYLQQLDASGQPDPNNYKYDGEDEYKNGISYETIYLENDPYPRDYEGYHIAASTTLEIDPTSTARLEGIIWYSLDTDYSFNVHFQAPTVESLRSGGKLVYEDLCTAEVWKGVYSAPVTNTYPDFKNPTKTIVDRVFTGFNFDKLSPSNFTIGQDPNDIYVLYTRDYYDPPTTEPAFTAHYFIQNRDAAIAGNDDIDTPAYWTEDTAGLVFGSPITFDGYFNELVKKNFSTPTKGDLFKQHKGLNIKGAKYSVDGNTWVAFPDAGFSINETHKQQVNIYYTRDVYNPDDPDNPQNGFTVTHMVQSLDYLIYGVGPEYIPYVDAAGNAAVDKHLAVYGDTVTSGFDVSPFKEDIQSFIEANGGTDPDDEDGGFMLNREKDISPVEQFIDAPNHNFEVYYIRNKTKTTSYQVVKMVKNEAFVFGDVSQPEYIQYGDVDTRQALYEEVVDATRSDLWPEILGDNYKFEHRCDPTSLVPWPKEEPVFALTASNDDVPTIVGYYDFIVSPENVNAQTGDSFPWGIPFALVGVAAVGLFFAMRRSKTGKHVA